MSTEKGSNAGTINVGEYNSRLEYLGFTQDSARALEKLKPWVEKNTTMPSSTTHDIHTNGPEIGMKIMT